MPVFALIVFTLPAPAQKNRQRFTPIDTAAIERIIGMKGKSNNGEYKITVPQNDLSIDVDGFPGKTIDLRCRQQECVRFPKETAGKRRFW